MAHTMAHTTKEQYPFYRTIYKLDKQHIQSLVNNFTVNISTKRILNAEHFEDEYFIIIDKWETNKEINSLTDYFTESVRIRCNIGKYKTPLEYYRTNKRLFIGRNITEQRDILFRNTKHCNNFKVSVVLTILKLFNVKKYLDISAGWGDRLLASLLFGVTMYCGVDPNKDLHKYYDDMIATFATAKTKKRYILIEDGFETATLPDTKFDMVFSSPPFFDLEKYSNYEADSLTKYKEEREWCDKFLMASLYKAYERIETGGHMILYIRSSSYLEKRLKELNRLMRYRGIIYFYDNKLRGMYVWQKMK